MYNENQISQLLRLNEFNKNIEWLESFSMHYNINQVCELLATDQSRSLTTSNDQPNELIAYFCFESLFNHSYETTLKLVHSINRNHPILMRSINSFLMSVSQNPSLTRFHQSIKMTQIRSSSLSSQLLLELIFDVKLREVARYNTVENWIRDLQNDVPGMGEEFDDERMINRSFLPLVNALDVERDNPHRIKVCIESIDAINTVFPGFGEAYTLAFLCCAYNSAGNSKYTRILQIESNVDRLIAYGFTRWGLNELFLSNDYLEIFSEKPYMWALCSAYIATADLSEIVFPREQNSIFRLDKTTNLSEFRFWFIQMMSLTASNPSYNIGVDKIIKKIFTSTHRIFSAHYCQEESFLQFNEFDADSLDLALDKLIQNSTYMSAVLDPFSSSVVKTILRKQPRNEERLSSEGGVRSYIAFWRLCERIRHEENNSDVPDGDFLVKLDDAQKELISSLPYDIDAVLRAEEMDLPLPDLKMVNDDGSYNEFCKNGKITPISDYLYREIISKRNELLNLSYAQKEIICEIENSNTNLFSRQKKYLSAIIISGEVSSKSKAGHVLLYFILLCEKINLMTIMNSVKFHNMYHRNWQFKNKSSLIRVQKDLENLKGLIHKQLVHVRTALVESRLFQSMKKLEEELYDYFCAPADNPTQFRESNHKIKSLSINYPPYMTEQIVINYRERQSEMSHMMQRVMGYQSYERFKVNTDLHQFLKKELGLFAPSYLKKNIIQLIRFALVSYFLPERNIEAVAEHEQWKRYRECFLRLISGESRAYMHSLKEQFERAVSVYPDVYQSLSDIFCVSETVGALRTSPSSYSLKMDIKKQLKRINTLKVDYQARYQRFMEKYSTDLDSDCQNESFLKMESKLLAECISVLIQEKEYGEALYYSQRLINLSLKINQSSQYISTLLSNHYDYKKEICVNGLTFNTSMLPSAQNTLTDLNEYTNYFLICVIIRLNMFKDLSEETFFQQLLGQVHGLSTPYLHKIVNMIMKYCRKEDIPDLPTQLLTALTRTQRNMIQHNINNQEKVYEMNEAISLVVFLEASCAKNHCFFKRKRQTFNGDSVHPEKKHKSDPKFAKGIEKLVTSFLTPESLN